MLLKNKTSIIIALTLATVFASNFGFANLASAATGTCNPTNNAIGAPLNTQPLCEGYIYSGPGGVQTRGVWTPPPGYPRCVAMVANPPIGNPQSSQAICEDLPPAGNGGQWELGPLPPQSNGNVVLTPAADLAAQFNPAACKRYSGDVSYVFLDSGSTGSAGAKIPTYKAVWNYGYFSSGCYIVPGNFGPVDSNNVFINIYTIFSQPPGAEQIQATIRAGRGISSNALLAQTARDQAASNEASTPSKIIAEVLEVIIGVITNVVSWLTAIVGGIFTYAVAEITKVQSFPPVVDVGWTVVRDIANMLFILVLIAISLGTILRIEGYNEYGPLLKKLILMALLVNFSKEIALVLMNFTSIIVRMFAIDYTGIHEIFISNIGFVGSLKQGLPNGVLAGLGDSIGQLVFALVSLFAFVALSGMFVIRLVGIYVLVVISPMAYVLNILPHTKNYAEDWWKHFIKYLVWAPVALFFVKLSVLTTKGGLGNIGAPESSAFRYFIVAGFMMAGVLVAEQAGMVGSKQVMDWAKKGVFGGAKFVGGGALGLAGRSYSKWASRNMNAAVGAGKSGKAAFWRAAGFVNLRVAKEAWEARSKEKEEEAYKPAVGDVHDTLNRVMPTEWEWKKGIPRKLGQRSYYGRIGQRELINHKTKLWQEANLSEEEKVEAYNGARHPEDLEALDTVLLLGRHEDGRAIITALNERKKRAEQLSAGYMAQGMDKESAHAAGTAKAKIEIKAEYDAVDDLDTITERLAHEGLSEEQIGSVLAHRDEVAEGENKLRGIGNAVYEFDNKFRTANNFSGYGKLEQLKGTDAMLKELLETKIFEKGDVEVMKMRNDKTGAIEDIEVVKSVKFKGQEIKNFADFQKVVKATKGSTRDSQNNLKYELTGARKQQSAQKRIARGDAEKWGAALEPAAFLVQNEDGQFKEFTSYGRRIFQEYDGANVNAFKKSRRLQARVTKAVGLYKDEKTGQIDAKNVKYNILAEALRLNKDLAAAIMSKADLDEDQFRTIKAQFKIETGNDMKLEYADIKGAK